MQFRWLVLIVVAFAAFNSITGAFASEFDNEIDDDDFFSDNGGSLYDDDTVLDEDSQDSASGPVKYEPTWSSLDSRPLPTWYDEAKIGIFIHWGIFSVPAYGGAWFWYGWVNNQSTQVEFMKENYPPKFTYQDFGPLFTAQFYNPTEWVDLFVKAGAKYVVLTSKHHEGFTNWPSKYSFSWNSMAIGPKRDLVGELAAATRKTDMKFGLYHSLYEFENPLYLDDKEAKFNKTEFVDFKTMPELYELVHNYEPAVIWSDGDWEATDVYWKSKEFLAWLYNESPVKDVVVTNDRWGIGTSCKHGGFYNCRDHFNPGVVQPHKWENAMTLDKQAWAYRAAAIEADFHTLNELIEEVVTTVSCGGNVLLNVGPTKEGTIIPIMQERLLQLGGWLGVNGDAIYGTSPWKTSQNDTTTKGVWYTAKPAQRQLYAIVLKDAWETMSHGTLLLDSVKVSNVKNIASVSLLGYPSSKLQWEVTSSKGMLVHLPSLTQFQHPIKTSYGWTIVITVRPGTAYF